MTIRQHVSQIYAKCGVSSRAELFGKGYVFSGSPALSGKQELAWNRSLPPLDDLFSMAH
jgi:hypothetical protein